MAFGRRVWFDRIVQRARTFRVTENQDDTITLTPETGEVLQNGTPLSANNLNMIERMAQHYSTAFDYLYSMFQANIRSLQEKFEIMNTYDATSEIDTGARWIDGKKIYRRMIQISTTTQREAADSGVVLSGVDKIISLTCVMNEGNGTKYPVNYYVNSSSFTSLYVSTDNHIWYTVNNNGTLNITVMYTKA